MSSVPMGSRLKRNIMLTILTGALSTIAANLTSPFYSLFVLRLGGNDYHVAWLSAFPALAAMLVLIPGGAFVDRFTYKKNITCWMIGANRFFYLTLAFVPFLPSLLQATVFVLFVGVMRVPGAVAEIGWQSFYADIIPEAHRGLAMARRSRVSSFVGMLVTFAAGQMLASLPKTDLERIHFYQIFFVLAFIFSIFEVYYHLRIREPRHEENERDAAQLHQTSLIKRFQLLFGSFKDTPQAKRFLVFSCCSIIFHFGWQMGWPLFNIYQIKTLHSNEFWLALISVIGSLVSIVAYTPWSRFAARAGNDRALMIAAFCMAVTPVLYTVSPNLPVLAVMNIVVGISTAGFTMILFNVSLNEAPRFQRTLYIACYNTVISLSAIIAPNIGVFFSELWGIHVALLITAFFRFIGTGAFFWRCRYHEKQKMRTAAL